MLKVNEIFTSIQGESTHAGKLCFFIRLSDCNLNCSYCDTEYAKTAENSKEYSIEKLAELAIKSGAKTIEITGGEPLLQIDKVIELSQLLLEKSLTVLIETNGSLSISKLPQEVIKIVDCKTPSSGENESNLYSNYDLLQTHDEIKFVIADFADYVYTIKIIDEYELLKKTKNILLSPVFGKINPQEIVEWMIQDKLNVRFQLQMHKTIWNPNERGV